MRILRVAWLLTTLACASGTNAEPDTVGIGTGGSLITGGFGASSASGGSAGDGGSACELGTSDHCGACDAACPGSDSNGTQRTCLDVGGAATCDVTCLGEWYDVNGDLSDGCELEDPIVQDSVETAVSITLPDVDDNDDDVFTSNPLNVVGYAYSDSRLHAEEPTSRPLGREDYYSVTAVGTGVSDTDFRVCPSISNFPADHTLEVCTSSAGDTAFPDEACVTVIGGDLATCVSPLDGGSEAGPYLIRVRRIEGTTPAPNGYALFLEH